MNVHHTNTIAKRSIQTVSEIARGTMSHSSIHWKHGVDSSLWSMAIDYSKYIYKHTPNRQKIVPAHLFVGSTVPRHKLKCINVFRNPIYTYSPHASTRKGIA